MRGIALYVHVPFCIKKCRYCDFVSYPDRPQDCLSEYFQIVSKELQFRVDHEGLQGVSLKSVYFGGGTPSLVSPRILKRFLSLLTHYFIFSQPIEITLEANPGTLNAEKLLDFADCGINRLSIGIQSFQQRYLTFLGRTYRTDEVFSLLNKLTAGQVFHNFSIDLIYSLPFQTFYDWKKEIQQLLFYQPPHVSFYSLTLSRRVPLSSFARRHPYGFPDRDWEASIYRWTQMVLRKHGYKRYEISNFAKPGFECVHNLTYWRNQEYLGLGVSACSYLKGVRTRNTRSLRHYQKKITNHQSPVVMEDILPVNQKISEEMILALRTSDGIQIDSLLEHYPTDLVQEKLDRLESYVRSGLLREVEGRWALSTRGSLAANQIFIDLLD